RVRLQRVLPGETLTLELARRAMRELLDTGRYADVRAEAVAMGDGALLRLVVLPRRLIASVRLLGGVLDDPDTLRTAQVAVGGELTAPLLDQIGARIRAHYLAHGYPAARVRADVVDTDDPLRVLLLVDITPGPPLRIAERWFGVWPTPKVDGLEQALSTYDAAPGDRVDEDALLAADRTLESTLKARGWHRASVAHQLRRDAGKAVLHVLVHAGPRMRIAFEGNHRFDATQLEAALELEDTEDRAPSTLVQRVREFYVKRGLFDVEVNVKERLSKDGAYAELEFLVVEGEPLRVSAREYPCLRGERSAGDVGSEIDSFLSEELPGAELLDAVDPGALDALIGPTSNSGARPRPYRLNPWKTYEPEVYERALKHLQDLYRSEGYLSAVVGPVEIVRRACQLHSPPNVCIPVGVRPAPASVCAYDDSGLPLEEPPPAPGLTCVPNRSKGLRCEREAVLHIPVKLGPRTFLYDIAFEGNRALVEKELEEELELELGAPASQVAIDKARRRLLDAYAEEGFAFAEVESVLELSPDRTRARVRFIISERERVRVSRIVVRGARLTSEGLIRSRVALEVGQPYRRSLVRKTEERLATLGVFSSVTVGFEDPYVPSREKVVVIELAEQPPQYTGVRGGFSTGEGFRTAFEYGHRNLLGQAIQLTLRVQLGYLPSALIFERDVRAKYDDLDVGKRLERRNTATLEFPEVGLGPLFRLSVEAVDVRDNARDFGLTKDAGILTLIYRPERGFSVQAGASLELNQADIFATDIDLSRVPFRVPEGTSVAVAERIGFTWDRRDNPLSATAGTLLSAGVEHVRACPDSWPCSNDEGADAAADPNPFAPAVSEFLRFTNRLAGYVRLSQKGLSFAASFRWGYNRQLFEESRTYPDRLFFLGGVESLRGYLQDSLIPEDIAQRILNPQAGETPLSVRDVAIRGGDLFVNPRVELRIPLTANVQTALFVDAGNLWTRAPGIENMFELRYAVGTGLRIATPVGPVVFDYGFNLDRVLDEFYPDRENQRFWEDIGAFHFSIGLF
ncbi:MAG TPA: POTRA domain-containing protein, partial [Polyangiaceae bacterium]|nr:POTRA domain-containing protein [Polyangiaceae bacterium]